MTPIQRVSSAELVSISTFKGKSLLDFVQFFISSTSHLAQITISRRILQILWLVRVGNSTDVIGWLNIPNHSVSESSQAPFDPHDETLLRFSLSTRVYRKTRKYLEGSHSVSTWQEAVKSVIFDLMVFVLKACSAWRQNYRSGNYGQ